MNLLKPGAARAKSATDSTTLAKKALQIAGPDALDDIPNTAFHADSVRKAQDGDSVVTSDR